MTSIKAEDDYTKQEKTIYLNPTAALAAAVIRQWKLDGCPQASKKEIEKNSPLSINSFVYLESRT